MTEVDEDMVVENEAGGPPVVDDVDSALKEISLPSNSIKRIVKSAAPGVRFSSEAIAGFHRVAQAFALFATDRALAEQQKDIDKVRKTGKAKNMPPPRKSLTAEHVMRFLSKELPPIASKVSTLFPDLMPGEFKPAGVQLLEQLREQSKAAADAAGSSSEQKTLAFSAASSSEQKTLAFSVAEQGVKRPADDIQSSNDPTTGGDAGRPMASKPSNDSSTAGDAGKQAATKPSAAKKAKTSQPAQSASLSSFFGAPKVVANKTPVVAQAASSEDAQPKEPPVVAEQQAASSGDAQPNKTPVAAEQQAASSEDAQPNKVPVAAEQQAASSEDALPNKAPVAAEQQDAFAEDAQPLE